MGTSAGARSGLEIGPYEVGDRCKKENRDEQLCLKAKFFRFMMEEEHTDQDAGGAAQ